MKSFDIYDNFESFVKASKIIKDKPSRINMKFETFDYRFSICFADHNAFESICKLVNNYYEYRKHIKMIDESIEGFETPREP